MNLIKTLKIGSLATAVFSMLDASSLGTIILTDNFDSYAAGDLVGQGGWLQTSTTATNPIQVTAGKSLSFINSGQDIYKALSSVVTHTNGSSVFAGFDVT